MEDRLQRAIRTIRERYHEPLSLDELARAATMSKYYFLRMFRRYTGVTPVRYLSTVRIHEAKRLLFSTGLDVAAISVGVGYGSLGTFTRRFTECVGLPPTRYRQLARGNAIHPAEIWISPVPGSQSGMVYGTVDTVPAASSPIFIGLFEHAIPQGRPVAWTAVTGRKSWHMAAVPAGSWHVLVAAEGAEDDLPVGTAARGPTGRPLLIGLGEQVRVAPCERVQLALKAGPVDWTRPPLLVALPGVEAISDAPAKDG